jgi:hypothetical protein
MRLRDACSHHYWLIREVGTSRLRMLRSLRRLLKLRLLETDSSTSRSTPLAASRSSQNRSALPCHPVRAAHFQTALPSHEHHAGDQCWLMRRLTVSGQCHRLTIRLTVSNLSHCLHAASVGVGHPYTSLSSRHTTRRSSIAPRNFAAACADL